MKLESLLLDARVNCRGVHTANIALKQVRLARKLAARLLNHLDRADTALTVGDKAVGYSNVERALGALGAR